MRAAVAQAEERPRIPQHLMDRCVIAAHIVHHGKKQIPVLRLGEIVIGDFVRGAPLAGGDRRNAELFGRLVVRRVSHHEELVPARGDELPELREPAHLVLRWFLVEDPATQLRIA